MVEIRVSIHFCSTKEISEVFPSSPVFFSCSFYCHRIGLYGFSFRFSSYYARLYIAFSTIGVVPGIDPIWPVFMNGIFPKFSTQMYRNGNSEFFLLGELEIWYILFPFLVPRTVEHPCYIAVAYGIFAQKQICQFCSSFCHCLMSFVVCHLSLVLCHCPQTRTLCVVIPRVFGIKYFTFLCNQHFPNFYYAFLLFSY
jgi:hypothetical protein